MRQAFPGYRRRPDFIQRYVFPGGMLPTPQILKSLGAEQGLSFLRERSGFEFHTGIVHALTGLAEGNVPAGPAESEPAED